MKTKIKIYAERNTGVVFLEWLLNRNFKVDITEDYRLGWKRRIAPAISEIPDDLRKEVLFICVVKNPYSWLLSMHRKPFKHENLQKLKFSEFIRTSFGDYENPVQLWNKKNRSYLEFDQAVDKYQLLHYEDLLAMPQHTLEQMSKKFTISKKMGAFKSMERRIDHHGKVRSGMFHKSYYLKERWRSEYRQEDVVFINEQLDHDLVQKLNYQFLNGMV